MTRFGWIVLGILLVIILAVVLAVLWFHSKPTPQPPSQQATTTPEHIETQSIYSSGEFGFTIMYPTADPISESFSPWRTASEATGTPILRITDPGGVVSIGASKNQRELKICTQVGPGETRTSPLQVGSTTFAGFTRDAIGTDNQKRVVSYRALREGACFAVETEQAITQGGIATSTSLQTILASFSLARP